MGLLEDVTLVVVLAVFVGVTVTVPVCEAVILGVGVELGDAVGE